MSHEHPIELLGGHALGILSPAEQNELERHLATCETCRGSVDEISETSAIVAEVLRAPLRDNTTELRTESGAGLHGPGRPGQTGGDSTGSGPDELLLRRVLRQIRAEQQPHAVASSGERPRARLTIAAAAALALFAAGAGGFVGSQMAEPDTRVIVAPTPTPDPSTDPSVDPEPYRILDSTDSATGVALVGEVVAANDWSRITISVSGVAPGERCRVVLVAKNGSRQIAGSWTVGDKPGVMVDGSVAIPPDQLDRIEIVTFKGEQVVGADI
jgi:Putative zinc-finger